jgi:hypothetical protein
MGIHHLQEYLETECAEACKEVDLLKIARGFVMKRRPGRGPGHLRLVVDAESCLDRLYGGYYSDWVCGGQWNRMLHFMTILMRACHSVNMELVVFFNGALENQRIEQWFNVQLEDKRKVNHVLKHINNKATPPPKVWWIAPVCVRSCLRMALRQMGVAVACSMDDHHQEVIAYCRENGFFGLVAQDSDYAIFDPPHYYSAHHLKLTYKGALETKEFDMDAIAKTLDLDPKRFCVLAALLGNHILSEEDLKEFFETILPIDTDYKNLQQKDLINAILTFVRSLESVDDLDVVGKQAFKLSTALTGKVTSFKQSVQYYLNGTQDGFLKYRPKLLGDFAFPKSGVARQPGSYPVKGGDEMIPTSPASKTGESKAETDEEDDKHDIVVGADSVYTQQESGYANSEIGKLPAPSIVIQPPTTGHIQDMDDLVTDIKTLQLDEDHEDHENHEDAPENQKKVEDVEDQPNNKEQKVAPSSGTSSTATSPNRASPESLIFKLKTQQGLNKSGQSGEHNVPKVTPEVMRIASERHQKGLMSPWIYQILTQGEIKLDVTMEDENCRDLPAAVDLYRTLRRHTYAVMFDLNKKQLIAKNNPSQLPEGSLDIVIKEYYLSKSSSDGAKCDMVRAQALEWKCPSIHRLWLGQAIEDKNRRLRAFLSCLLSDSSMMLNTSYVPQHLLIMCCVLRYMLRYHESRVPVLRRHELDAFLATALSPLLHDVETMQEMKLPMITTRGVQLAALFMRGVQSAMFANDGCGAPIPWSMCCPWHFFDGKLFHFKLLKANNNTPLIDICDGHVDQVMKVERMRNAILERLQPESVFAKPPLPLMSPQFGGGGPSLYGHPGPYRAAGMNPMPMAPGQHPGFGGSGPGRGIGRAVGRDRGRGLLGHSPVDGRGGQLQIAGVVVGSWGGNSQGRGNNPNRPGRGASNSAPPHVMSVGPRHGGRGVVTSLASQGRGYVRPAPGGNRGMNRPAQMSGRGYNAYNNNMMGAPRGMRNTSPRGKWGRPYGPGQHDLKMTLEQQTKSGSGRGRGCTVENYADGPSILPVSELMKYGIHGQKSLIHGQFDDANMNGWNGMQ